MCGVSYFVMNFPRIVRLLLFCVISGAAVTQVQPYTPQPGASPQQTANVPEITPLLSKIEQETQALNADVGRLRIDRWKADSSAKQQAEQNVTSIRRNIAAALPELINPVRSAPQSLAANFKLYRNLNALYEVLSGLAETTGAFGKRDEYDVLAQHVNALDEIRRSYADSLQQMSSNADTRIATFQQALAQAQAQAAPPKKIIVDNDEPAPAVKKPKKPAKKPSTSGSAKPAAGGSSSASTSSGGTSSPK